MSTARSRAAGDTASRPAAGAERGPLLLRRGEGRLLRHRRRRRAQRRRARRGDRRRRAARLDGADVGSGSARRVRPRQRRDLRRGVARSRALRHGLRGVAGGDLERPRPLRPRRRHAALQAARRHDHQADARSVAGRRARGQRRADRDRGDAASAPQRDLQGPRLAPARPRGGGVDPHRRGGVRAGRGAAPVQRRAHRSGVVRIDPAHRRSLRRIAGPGRAGAPHRRQRRRRQGQRDGGDRGR